MFYHVVKVGIDDKGNAIAWQHRLVGQSFMFGTAL